MKVLVDFLPLMPRGGGLQNARNLWRALDRHGGAHRWIAVARPGLGLDAEVPDHMELRLLDPDSLAGRLHAENVVIPRWVRDAGADLIWTPMGAGPLRGGVPRVMGWHDSTVVYPEVGLGRRMGPVQRAVEAVRDRVARAAARRAAAITVQTGTMGRRLSAHWGVDPDRFHIVPNGPSAFLAGEEAAPPEPPETPTVLVVAEAKPAKNLEVVPEVAARLRDLAPEGVRFVLTIPPDGGSWLEPFERAVERAGPDLPLERIGRVPHEELGALYRSASAVFLPSLMESFSATYLEAMHFGVPLVTSDRDFARDICGDAASYADPLDPAACAAALARTLEDTDLRARLREAGFRRLATFPDWEERLGLYLGALEAAVGSGSRSAAGVP